MEPTNNWKDDAADYWRAVVESAGLGVWDYNTVTGEKRYSDRWREIRKLTPSDVMPETDEEWLATVHPDDVAAARHYTEMINTGQADEVSFEYRERGKSGHWIWIMCRGRALSHDETGRATRFVGVDTDITVMKSAEQERVLNAKQLEIAVTIAGIGIWRFDILSQAVTWDARLREIYGVAQDLDPLPRDIWERFIHPEDYDFVMAQTRAAEALREDYNLDYRILRADGDLRHIRSRMSYVPDSLDGPCVIGVNWDATEDLQQAFLLEKSNQIAGQRLAQLTLAQTELERLSRTDPLTGLPNRRALDEYLQRVAPDVRAHSTCAVMLIDIDQFKTVNDTRGHAFGDKLLKVVANVLDCEIAPQGFLARIGGDEFLAILEQESSIEALMAIASAAVARVREASRNLGQEVSISIGIDAPQVHPATMDDLCASADKAMYRAKLLGGAQAFMAA